MPAAHVEQHKVGSGCELPTIAFLVPSQPVYPGLLVTDVQSADLPPTASCKVART
jgi:hypothetical protein